MKIINDTDRIVEGWGSVQIVDKQGELVPIDSLEKVMLKYMKRGAPLIDTHSNKVIGKILNFQRMKKGDKEGLWLTGLIYNDYDYENEVWNKIKSGEYQGFSWGGEADRIIVNDTNELKDLEVYEWSVCKTPANPEAKIEAVSIAKSEVKKPFGAWENFEGCVADMQKEGYDEETANKICAVLHKKLTGKYPNEKGEVKMKDETIEHIKNFIEDKAEYDWDKCISDMKEEGYSEESANKICAAIKNRSVKHSLDKGLAKSISEAVTNIATKVEKDELYSYILNKISEVNKMVDKQDDEKPKEQEKPKEEDEEKPEEQKPEEKQDEAPAETPEEAPKEKPADDTTAALNDIKNMLLEIKDLLVNNQEVEMSAKADEPEKPAEPTEETKTIKAERPEVKKSEEDLTKLSWTELTKRRYER